MDDGGCRMSITVMCSSINTIVQYCRTVNACSDIYSARVGLEYSRSKGKEVYRSNRMELLFYTALTPHDSDVYYLMSDVDVMVGVETCIKTDDGLVTIDLDRSISREIVKSESSTS